MKEAVSVVLHGHFYQPPRENPWTGEVEAEPSAAPDHDWNARINRECYQALGSIPIGDGETRPLVNAYDWLSFNVGPTLLEWLERAAPASYFAMMAGDAASARRLGHGNAIAMPYHHAILPLSSPRDRRTEVRWGIADFRRRFRREPAGMWLPETAVDDDTLDILAAEGIAFTVLAPHQVSPAPADGLPARISTRGGRSIAVFAYDGGLAHAVAFGDMMKDAISWEKALLQSPRKVISLATDGETFGHHHKFADLALGALLYRLGSRVVVRLENFASVLARTGPVHEATLVSPSSWSCTHGVERWRSDCGCRMSTTGSSQQGWRVPLRLAIGWLVQEADELYESGMTALGLDAWPVRDAAPVWERVMHPDAEANRLLDLNRSALRALTSCGWFFDDFGALEGRQVLRYAARAIGLAEDEAPRLEAGFLERLDGAVSNDPAVGTAADWYRNVIVPAGLAR